MGRNRRRPGKVTRSIVVKPVAVQPPAAPESGGKGK